MAPACTRFLCEHGHTVLEVNRPNRQLRRQKGKDDPLDAESAARAVLAGQAGGLGVVQNPVFLGYTGRAETAGL